jgi:hypothetical protein
MKFELILGMKMLNNSMMVEETGLKNLDPFPCECCVSRPITISLKESIHHVVIR